MDVLVVVDLAAMHAGQLDDERHYLSTWLAPKIGKEKKKKKKGRKATIKIASNTEV